MKQRPTIKDYVLGVKEQGINDWISRIKKDGFQKHERSILACADHFNKIKINEKASFIKSLSN